MGFGYNYRGKRLSSDPEFREKLIKCIDLEGMIYSYIPGSGLKK